MSQDRPWYAVIIAGLLALACLGGAFYCIVYTDVDAAVYAQFFTFAGLLIGYIIGQAAPSSMTALLNRSSVVAAQPVAPDYVHPADAEFVAAAKAQRAEADAALQ